MRGRHRARNGWFRRPTGNPDQPQPGRHTHDYHHNVAPEIGMHPLGAARRQTPENNTHSDHDRESDNDPGRLFR